jgi:hypothetical protein
MARNYSSYINAYNRQLNQYNIHQNQYNNMANQYSSFVSTPSLSSFTPDLTGARNNELRDAYIKLLRGEQKPAEREKQTLLQRVFNVLNLGNYASAGFVMGFVDDDISPLQGLSQGVRASLAGFNPWSKGHEDWEYSYQDVLEKAGWQPKTAAGKIGKFGVGLALDIALDPLTYVSGGTSALFKGSGKSGVKVASKGAAKAGATSKYLDEALDLAKGVGMNIDTATDLVKNSKYFKAHKTTLNLAEEAAEFVTQYNKLIGVTDNVGKTLSLSHLPFGKKIFGSYADKSIELISAETIGKIGDVTLAPIYAELRDKVLGGKIGKLFSTKHKAYKLAQTDPEELFNFFKYLDSKKGIKASRLIKKDLIAKQSKIFDDLTPAEQKEVIRLLEDKSKWSKVSKPAKFANKDEVLRTKKKVIANKLEVKDKLTKAKRNLKYNEGRIKEIYGEAMSKQDALDDLLVRRASALDEININRLKDEELVDEFIVVSKDVSQEFDAKLKSTIDIKDSTKKFRDYELAQKQANLELELRGKLLETFHSDTIDFNFNPKTPMNKKISYNDTLDTIVKDYIAKNEPFKELPRSTAQRYKKEVAEYGFKSFAPSQAKHADVFEARVPGWEKVIDHTGSIRFYPPKEISGMDASIFNDAVYKSLPNVKTDKFDFIDDVSQYLFGKKGMLSYNIHDANLSEIAKWIEDGVDPEDMINRIFNNRELYNGVSYEIYSHIARQLNYHNWYDEYVVPMKELNDIVESGGKLTLKQKEKEAKLIAKKIKRDAYLHEFKDVKTLDDWKKAISEFNEAQHSRMVDDVIETFINDGLDGLPRQEALRNEFNIFDHMEDLKPGEIRRAHHRVHKGFDPGVSTEARELIAEHIAYSGRFGNINIPNDKSIQESLEKWNMIVNTSNARLKEIEDSIYKATKQGEKYLSSKSPDALRRYNETLEEIKRLNNNKEKIMSVAKNAQAHIDSNDVVKIAKINNKNFNKEVDDVAAALRNILINSKETFGRLDPIDQSRFIDRAYQAVLRQRAFFRHNPDLAKSNSSVKKGLSKLKEVAGDAKVKVAKNTNSIIENTDFTYDTIKRLDDIANHDVLYNEFVVRQRDLYKFRQDYLDGVISPNMSKIELVPKTPEAIAEELSEIRSVYDELAKEVDDLYKLRIETLRNDIEKITDKGKINIEKVQQYSSDIDDYVKHLDEIDNALSSLEGLETYAQIRMGKDTRPFHTTIEKIILNPDVDVNDNVRKMANTLRDEFFRMGKIEVGMGKLSDEAFEAMTMEYLPHILTDEGREMVNKNKKIQKFIKGFGDDFGYGREFDPYARTRKIKKITLNGEVIENPNVMQINEFFKEEMLGNNLFSEDIANIYLQRATKNLDLMYDNNYMENMLELFGTDYTGEIRDGFDTVMNYGMLKKSSQDIVNAHTSIDISENISNWIKEDRLFEKAVAYADKNIGLYKLTSMNDVYIKREELIDRFMGDKISEYMRKVLTKEVRSEMYLKNLQEFYNYTGVGELIDNVALPLSPVNDDHIRTLREATEAVQKRYAEHIQDKFFGLNKIKNTKKAREEFPIEKITELLEESILDPSTNALYVKKYEDLLDKIKKFNNIKEPQIKQVNSAIIENANMTRQIQIQRDNSRLLSIYDRFLHFIKLNQTTVLPSFHIRNAFSNMFNNWFETGLDAIDPKFRKQTAEVMRGYRLDDVLDIVGKDGVKSSIEWGEVLRKAKEFGVLDEGMFATELGSMAGGDGLLKKFISGKFDPTDTRNFVLYKKGSEIGQFVEGNDRFIHFASQLKRGMSFKEAAESVNKFLFDYSDLTLFEQSVMKRVFPYYTWLRKNSALQLEQIMTKPNKYRLISKVLGGIESMVDEDDRLRDSDRSDFLNDWVQLPFSFINNMGQKEPLMWNPNLPYQDINRIPDITDLGNSLRNLLSQTSPMIKLPIELAMNKNLFFDSKIHNDELEPKIDSETGEVIKPPSRLADYSWHIANQFGVVPQIAGFAKKEGVDLGLHALKNLTGFSSTAYNVTGYKWRKMQERIGKNPTKYSSDLSESELKSRYLYEIKRKREALNRMLGR